MWPEIEKAQGHQGSNTESHFGIKFLHVCLAKVLGILEFLTRLIMFQLLS